MLHFVTQPLFWSESQQAHIWEAVPLKGSMKGSEMKRLLLKAGLGELPGATGSPNLPLCFSLTCQHPFLSPILASLSSLKPHPVGELLLTTQALWGRHQGGLEMKSPFLENS